MTNLRRVKFPGPDGEMTGYFHAWGLIYHSGLHQTMSVAIIEMANGEIRQCYPGEVTFIDTIPETEKLKNKRR